MTTRLNDCKQSTQFLFYGSWFCCGEGFILTKITPTHSCTHSICLPGLGHNGSISQGDGVIGVIHTKRAGIPLQRIPLVVDGEIIFRKTLRRNRGCDKREIFTITQRKGAIVSCPLISNGRCYLYRCRKDMQRIRSNTSHSCNRNGYPFIFLTNLCNAGIKTFLCMNAKVICTHGCTDWERVKATVTQCGITGISLIKESESGATDYTLLRFLNNDFIDILIGYFHQAILISITCSIPPSDKGRIRVRIVRYIT